MDRRCKFTKEQKQEMVEMYLSGKSSVEIGKRFNITNTNVIGYLNRAGIKRRTNKENSRKYSVNNDYFDKILQPIRDAFGKPIIISSGFRCVQLNKKVGLSFQKLT